MGREQGFELSTLPNGQMVLFRIDQNNQKDHKNIQPIFDQNVKISQNENFDTNFGYPTYQQTIDRVVKEANDYTLECERAEKNLQPRPSPPIWLNRKDFILSQKELSKMTDLKEPDDKK